jgi:hypothetical protein
LGRLQQRLAVAVAVLMLLRHYPVALVAVALGQVHLLLVQQGQQVKVTLVALTIQHHPILLAAVAVRVL